MSNFVSRHRLRSSAFDRPDEMSKINPKRVIFLSVEGDETERTYFQHLNSYLDHSLIQIEVLRHRRGDGYSDPQYVIELLDEYLRVRQGQLVPEETIAAFTKKYTRDEIQAYLEGGERLPRKTQNSMREELLLVGIDIDYRRYLQHYGNEDNQNDIFAVVLDRDCGSHSRELLAQCVSECEKNGYHCFLTNPCFEFWLLMHLSDIKAEFSETELSEFLKNAKVSQRHTKVSTEVTKRAHHTKTISKAIFDTHYLPNITKAIARADWFAKDYPALLDALGTNLPQLFAIFASELPSIAAKQNPES